MYPAEQKRKPRPLAVNNVALGYQQGAKAMDAPRTLRSRATACPSCVHAVPIGSQAHVPPPFHKLPLVWLFTLGNGEMGATWCVPCVEERLRGHLAQVSGQLREQIELQRLK